MDKRGIVLTLLLVGCSARSVDTPSSDGSVHLGPRVDLMTRVSGLFEARVRDARLEALGGAFVVRAPRPPGLARLAHVRLAPVADGASSIADDVTPVRAEIRLLGARSVSGTVVDGRLHFAGVFGMGTHMTQVPRAEGFEDFVAYESRPKEPTLRYAVTLSKEVAGLRLVGGSLELIDRTGTPRLRAAPPWIVEATGKRRDARLDVEGCEVDRDPRAPWGRPPVQAGHAVCEVVVSWPSDAEYPIVVDPAWTTTGSMSQARWSPVAGRIGIGRAIVHGGAVGQEGTGALSTAEIFDLDTGAFAATESSYVVHSWTGAATLDDGTFLVAGGQTDWGATTRRTEIYDPSTGHWHLGADMPDARASYEGLLLRDGSFMALPFNFEKALIYSPKTDKWVTTSGPVTARRQPSGAVLQDGRVLVAGGIPLGSGFTVTSTELYDPTSSTWSGAGDLATALGPFVNVVARPDGGAVLFGGRDVDAYTNTTVQRWSPSTSSWSVTGPSATKRDQAMLAQLPSGKVLSVACAIGVWSYYSALVDSYDPVTDRWESYFPLAQPRTRPAVVVFPSGSVLVAGGGSEGNYAPRTSAELNAGLPNSAKCGGHTECVSGNCVDGVCCNTACASSCSACDIAGSSGTCSVVPSGTPHGARSCGDYGLCTGGACNVSCTADSDCASGRYCDTTGHCKPKKSSGYGCAAAKECANGFCVDGYCCESACSDVCAACDMPGKLGLCVPAFGPPHGARTGCVAVGPGTRCGAQCDGADTKACHYPNTAVSCGANTCTDGTARQTGFCDGKGACDDSPKSCGAYACGATACLTACTTSDQCGTSYYCKSGTCAAAEGAGTPCSTTRACAAGLFCTDGVCCDKSDCGEWSSCAAEGKKGSCTKIRGAKCGESSECASGHCVDGVCCDSACDGQCEACDVELQLGRCVPVDGMPHGTRTACSPGVDKCDARTCNGIKDRKSCVGFAADTSTECAEAFCNDKGDFVPVARCNGAGKCAPPLPAACGVYACRSTGCLESCTSEADCATGYRCVSGSCKQIVATCTNSETSQPPAGAARACAPYACDSATGLCLSACRSTADCASSFVCNSEQVCQSLTQSEGDADGGCSLSAGGRTTASGLALTITALAGLACRLRRRVVRRPRAGSGHRDADL